MPDFNLEWTDGDGRQHRREIVDKVFVGRICQGIEESKRIIVENPHVSGDHAIVSMNGAQPQITDLSENGVWVNQVRMAAGSSQRLRRGDAIGIGTRVIKVHTSGSTSSYEDVEGTTINTLEIIVTSLVADVRGFSGISQEHDSVQVAELLQGVFETLSAIVCENNGTIKDFVGDAVYAFWDHGYEPRKEQALSACHAAVRQLQVVEDMRIAKSSCEDTTGARLLMGWGITTGRVTMTRYSPRAADLALVGDCTNLAFRLSGMANKDIPSPIALCFHTAGLVRDCLELCDLGCVDIRGRTGQEHVFGVKQVELLKQLNAK